MCKEHCVKLHEYIQSDFKKISFDRNCKDFIFCKYVYAVCTSRKFCKLECATRDENPTRLEVQQRLGTSLAQVLFDYSHQEAVKLLDSIPVKLSQQLCCASQDSQLKADAMGTWVKKQEILRSYLHSNILGNQWICIG